MPYNAYLHVENPHQESMIKCLKKDQGQPLLDAAQFFSGEAKFFVVTIEEDSTLQCVDSTQLFGFSLVKARLEYAIIVLNGKTYKLIRSVGNPIKRGEIESSVQGDHYSSLDVSNGFYLAETYFEQDGTLYVSFGSEQKPMQAGHRYLIRVLHSACNVQEGTNDFLAYTNVAPFYSELPILLFDEKNFYDINDLTENEESEKLRAASGLYEHYNERQYSIGKDLIEYVNSLDYLEYKDFVELVRKMNNPDNTETQPQEQEQEPVSEPEPEKSSWFLPAAIGFGAGALVCLVPTAVVLLVKAKKRKKSEKNEE